jgi:tetraacyldisaccharide 4'-kinase
MAFPVIRMRSRWIEELPSSRWRWLLSPAWLAYRPLIAARNLAYDRRWLAARGVGVPVISVGNLAAGGTGKTPAVALLGSLARERGAKPAVVSRGYRGGGGANDEARLMGDLPVVCDSDRVRGGARAVSEHGADLLLLDDGFQHRRLARDRDVVLIDATDPWGAGAVLPLGRLREGRHALRRADLLWLSRADLVGDDERARLLSELAQFGKPVVRVDQGAARLRPLAAGESRDAPAGPLVLASGIGNPHAFELTITRAGWAIAASYRYPDHHAFDRGDVDDLLHRAPSTAAFAITAKDAVKLSPLLTSSEAKRWWVVESDPRPDAAGLAALRELVAESLGSRPSHGLDAAS